MANLQAAAILKRVREVIDDGLGSVRVVATTRFEGDLPAGLDEAEQSRRAVVRPRFEVSIDGLRPHPSTPIAEKGSRALYELDISIRCVYHLESPALGDDARDATRAVAAVDADILRQALGWPGNLTATNDPVVATGIVSGLLRFVSYRVEGEDFTEGTRLLATRHEYTGAVEVAPATA